MLLNLGLPMRSFKESFFTGLYFLSGEKNPIEKLSPSLILKDNGDVEFNLKKKKMETRAKILTHNAIEFFF